MEKYAGMNKGEVRLYELLESIEDEAHKIYANFVVDRHKEGTNQIDAMLICKIAILIGVKILRSCIVITELIYTPLWCLLPKCAVNTWRIK